MKVAETSLKRVENTVGKEEIACYEQFLLSNSVFKRLELQTRKNQGLFGKGLSLGDERKNIGFKLVLSFTDFFPSLFVVILTYCPMHAGSITPDGTRAPDHMCYFLTHSLILHFETIPNSKKLQMTLKCGYCLYLTLYQTTHF